jgi:hypothetical protein
MSLQAIAGFVRLSKRGRPGIDAIFPQFDVTDRYPISWSLGQRCREIKGLRRFCVLGQF